MAINTIIWEKEKKNNINVGFIWAYLLTEAKKISHSNLMEIM